MVRGAYVVVDVVGCGGGGGVVDVFADTIACAFSYAVGDGKQCYR